MCFLYIYRNALSRFIFESIFFILKALYACLKQEYFLNRQARSPPSFWRPLDDKTFAPLFALSALDSAVNADRYTSMRLI